MSQPAITDAFFALPYNPHGLERTSYNWHMPERWFNMKQDASILIGTDFWDKIGGMGTYQEILDAVSEISGEYKERIYREFLGMEPPPNSTVKL